jgi:precorrin-2 dehydrogenase/sirohydrochlorin ferrochelatase
MSLFPMFLKLEDRHCLVVGAGKIGESKIRSLLVAHAKVRVIAPWATPTVTAWARAGVLDWEVRTFQPDDLYSIFLVVGATSSIEVNDAVYREAQNRQILCNIVDDPERCDFYYPSVVRRGDLQVAISTAGHSPALAQRLRREFEAQLAPVYAGWLDELGKTRKDLFARPIDPESRRKLLHSAASRQSFEARQSERQVNEHAFREVVHER